MLAYCIKILRSDRLLAVTNNDLENFAPQKVFQKCTKSNFGDKTPNHSLVQASHLNMFLPGQNAVSLTF